MWIDGKLIPIFFIWNIIKIRRHRLQTFDKKSIFFPFFLIFVITTKFCCFRLEDPKFIQEKNYSYSCLACNRIFEIVILRLMEISSTWNDRKIIISLAFNIFLNWHEILSFSFTIFYLFKDYLKFNLRKLEWFSFITRDCLFVSIQTTFFTGIFQCVNLPIS